MKSIIIILIALLTLSESNAQMISRSSISSMSAFTSTEAGIVSQSISRMSLVTTATEEVTFNEVAELTTTAVSEVTENSTIEFATLTAYPNPAIDNIHFSFELSEVGNVNVSVYNAMGQKVSDVYTSNYDGGKNTQQIDLTSYTSGIYFISLNLTPANSQTKTITRKIQVIR